VSDLRTRVRVLLGSLGTTADDVADSLRRRGIKGVRDDGCACPIANLIRAEIPEAREDNGARWSDDEGAWFVCGSYVRTPDNQEWGLGPIEEFVDAFDEGFETAEGWERPYTDLEEA
jgi:hypothetical protein